MGSLRSRSMLGPQSLAFGETYDYGTISIILYCVKCEAALVTKSYFPVIAEIHIAPGTPRANGTLIPLISGNRYVIRCYATSSPPQENIYAFTYFPSTP